jgi:hypothetical protein
MRIGSCAWLVIERLHAEYLRLALALLRQICFDTWYIELHILRSSGCADDLQRFAGILIWYVARPERRL